MELYKVQILWMGNSIYNLHSTNPVNGPTQFTTLFPDLFNNKIIINRTTLPHTLFQLNYWGYMREEVKTGDSRVEFISRECILGDPNYYRVIF